MHGAGGERLEFHGGLRSSHKISDWVGNDGLTVGDGVGVGATFKEGVSSKRSRIRLKNARKIWGTLRSTISAAILNVVKKTACESLANRLTVKNGSVATWWFVVRGAKSDIDALVEVWDTKPPGN